MVMAQNGDGVKNLVTLDSEKTVDFQWGCEMTNSRSSQGLIEDERGEPTVKSRRCLPWCARQRNLPSRLGTTSKPSTPPIHRRNT